MSSTQALALSEMVLTPVPSTGKMGRLNQTTSKVRTSSSILFSYNYESKGQKHYIILLQEQSIVCLNDHLEITLQFLLELTN